MSIGILLITHPGIGTALLANASAMLEACPLQARCLEVPPEADPEQLQLRAREVVETIDDGSGVLILTDAFGSTPSNIAWHLAEGRHITVISGVNLPMLVRIFNYATDELEALTRKAAEGGVRGIQVSLTGDGQAS